MNIQDTISRVEAVEARRGANILLEVLRAQGVEYIFGNPGTTELPLMDALVDFPEVGYILALQEASAVAMADGYAQAARRPGFLNLHTAGGLGHGMGNLLNAAVSQTPLVVTAGQQDSRHMINDPLLLGDLVQLARPSVKWSQEVTHADHIPVLVSRAFNDAMAAPRGPVFLSLPMNIMEEMSTVAVPEASHVDRSPVAGSLELLASRLANIEPGRLAIIAGDEIHAGDAAGSVVEIAELLAAPVFGSSWPSCIPFPTAHPLWKGNLPTKATEIARWLEPYEAIFALGGKSLITILYTEGSAVPPSCAVYQLSADVRDLGRTFPTALSAVGDIRRSLETLQPLLETATKPRKTRYGELLRQADADRKARRNAIAERARAQFDAPAISPLVAAQQAVMAIGHDMPIVDEAIATSLHIRDFLDSTSSAQYSFLRGGALGWGMPAAVGCSLGLGRSPVVCIVGDGAALYSPQALWTAAHEELPVTFVVMNNREYNVLKNFMKAQTGYASVRDDLFIAMDLKDPAIDYRALATSMGVPSRQVQRAADIAPAIEAGIRSGKPNLVEILIATQ